LFEPAGWARQAVEAYHEFRADRLIAERNFGGALVEHTIRTEDPNIAYREVVASRGKVARPEPVAALYEQGRVSHIGDLAALEDQMCQMTSTGFLGEGSPDACDAAVWALSDLMVVAHAPQFLFA
jgi:phage terminase large subunit-like protein